MGLQAAAPFSASPSALASSADISTTRRPPPSSGTLMTMPRPSLVTSSGPSPVRGFIAAIRAPLSSPSAHRALDRQGTIPRASRCQSLSRIQALARRSPGMPCPARRVNAAGLLVVNARSALFDLYGDHLRSRGGRARVASLVALLGPLDIAAPAVRTAVSRMVKQGWLRPTRIGRASGYALTARAERRLEEAAARIYRTRDVDGWDARWHLLVPDRPSARAARERLKSGLQFLGYAPLGDGAWVAARPSPELTGLLEAEGVHAERFAAAHESDDAELVRRAWDLEVVGRAYDRWLVDARALVGALPRDPSDRDAFAVRSR